ncbi:MAG TPA: c-type cytochrome [Acidimicrobiales bacterium]|nr:c-type cytochrome [Acidimicrobiales bacterium]
MNSLPVTGTVLGASTVTTIGAVIAVLVGVGAVVFLVANLRASRPEVGSEIDLAPNRKPYLDDDALETTRLNSTLRWALVLLVISAVGLPVYWLNEPGRQSGAIEDYERTFALRGEERYVEGSQCQNCHGPDGVGGVATYTITDADNQFVATVQWRAPALNTVLLRFSRDEVKYIINYGRPFSPMVGWGAEVNKGPLNEQQIDNLVDYLASIQLTSEETRLEIQGQLASQLGLIGDDEVDDPDAVAAANEQIDYTDPEVGRILFNLGRDDSFASGAYACGRCHTRGWSILNDPSQIEPSDADVGDYVDFPDGSGALGPNLTGGLIPRQFANVEEMVEFISVGSIDGEPYGNNGIGSGKMPGFGDNPNTEEVEGDGMMTQEMIEAIVAYEANLPARETTTNAPAGERQAATAGSTTTTTEASGGTTTTTEP